MGLFTLVEDRPTPPSVYNWRVYVLAVVASCGSNMIGYTSAFIGTTIGLDSFRDEFGLDKMTSAQTDLISENIVSLFVAGAFFGALFTYGLSYFIGRRSCLSIAAAVFTVGAALQCGATGSTGLGILYAGRVLSGLGTGIASNTIPIYISELAPPAIRGRLVGLYELGWQIGGLVGFWINVSHTPTMLRYCAKFSVFMSFFFTLNLFGLAHSSGPLVFFWVFFLLFLFLLWALTMG